jgi:ketosteroid isomerase-like protein
MTTLIKTDNIAACQAMYEAFGRGDVPGVLAHMAADIALDDWTGNSAVDSGLMINMKPRFGTQGVIDFFTAMGGGMEFEKFEVTNLLAGGNQVAATVSLRTLVKATGKTVSDDMIHLWTFNDDGKAVRFLHYLDTAKHMAAHS